MYIKPFKIKADFFYQVFFPLRKSKISISCWLDMRVHNFNEPFISILLKTQQMYSDDLTRIKDNILSPRELDILACVFNQLPTKKIASLLGVSSSTIETHIRTIIFLEHYFKILHRKKRPIIILTLH